jgi:D-lyxose ketol-isomerase
MKRSEINATLREATDCFQRHHWALPPNPRWDITDFGLGDFNRFGLALINLAEEPEYCEKVMYARPGQTTPAHTHAKKRRTLFAAMASSSSSFGPRIQLPRSCHHPSK